MAEDPATQSVVVEDPIATWNWDGQHWNQLTATSGPGNRQQAGMAYDDRNGRVLLFGGLGVHRAEVEVAEPLEVRTRCGLVHQRATWTLLAVDCPQCPRLQEETSRFLREVDPG